MSGADRRRILIAGATGVIGIRLVGLLTAAHATVAGITRSPEKASSLAALGAVPVVCDVFDRDGLSAALQAFAPDTVLHQLTDLPDEHAKLAGARALNDRMRTEGTRNLLDAARAADVARFLAQSVAWKIPGAGGAAVAEHERMVLAFGGVVLRYGQFHGPGTYYEHDPPDPPRVRVEHAARVTVELLDAPSGIVEITDEATTRL